MLELRRCHACAGWRIHGALGVSLRTFVRWLVEQRQQGEWAETEACRCPAAPLQKHVYRLFEVKEHLSPAAPEVP